MIFHARVKKPTIDSCSVEKLILSFIARVTSRAGLSHGMIPKQEDQTTHKSVGHSGFGRATTSGNEDVSARQHLQGIKRKINPGEQSIFAA